MSKTYKHQATYNYLHKNKIIKKKLLYGVLRFLNRIYFNKYDFSRQSWYKHKLFKYK